MKKLEDQIKDTEKKAKDLQKTWDDYKKSIEEVEKAHEKMTKTISDWLRDLQFQAKKLNDEYQETLDKINSSLEKDLWWNVQDFLREWAEKAVELQKKLKELEQEYNTEEDATKRYEIEQERLALTKELETVQANLAQVAKWEYETLLETERKRAELAEQDKKLYDFKDQQEQLRQKAEEEKKLAEEKYNAEIQKLEELRKVYQLFDEMQNVSVKDLEKLKNDERLKTLTQEQQELFEKLLTERIEYQTTVETKRKLNYQLQLAIRAMERDTTDLMRQNISRLSSDYQSLIATINNAISAQKQLIAISQRYAGGPVEAWQPYLVWENPDGSINKTTELFVPRQSGSIINAQQVQEALRTITNTSIDQSRRIEWTTINVSNGEDMTRVLQKMLFRL